MGPCQRSRAFASGFLDILTGSSQRVVVFDGAMGTQIQALEAGREADLDLNRDFRGHDGCNEVLCRTRADLIGSIHEAYLAAGADAIETNSFGANAVVLGEYGIADELEELNRAAAEIARRAADKFATPDRPRFVVGAMGPGTKLPSLGHTDFDALADSYRRQAAALIAGGADVLLLETCQDILQAKAGLAGATDAMERAGRSLPLMVQVTMEATGTLLVGTEIAAVLAILDPFEQIAVVGINCATGPAEMSEHVRHLGRHSRRPVSVQPNAGLPQMVAGRAHYPLAPAELADWARRFVTEDGVAIVGGCCGTTPEHIRAVADMVATLTESSRERKGSPIAKRRDWGPQLAGAPVHPTPSVAPGTRELPLAAREGVEFEPSVASLYSAVELRQEPAPLIVGERANANGSRRFRELLEGDDLDGQVTLAREQANEGAHVIDVCTAYVGRDEQADMTRLVGRLATDCPLPLMIDSTEAPVIEAALKRIGGRAIINSINLEDGEGRMARLCPLARRYGAAVVALTIDEQGMAKTADRKLAVARRIFELATGRFGLRPCDLLFDPLTFTLGSGDAEFRRAGIETLDAIRRIKADLPGVFALLGVSNISFGLAPPARHVLNSVFLHHAIEAGLDAAIVHAGRIVPLNRIPDRQRELARRLVFDERTGTSDPLTELMAEFAAEPRAEARGHPAETKPLTVEDKLKQRIIDGDRTGLADDLDAALRTHAPLDIINTLLLDGMKVVGELFGAGQMQLPFVLQSAETMKAAVRRLEPLMEKSGAGGRGAIVLATVKGDVHDIGKNLVDIILTNNGYRVVNLGIRQPIGRILEAARTQQADAIGLSGLLVKSALVMREDLEELNRQGVSPPVLLGGAALTRKYVEEDLRAIYRGRVFYGADAFAGLRIMDALMAEKRGDAEVGAAEKASAPGAGKGTTGRDRRDAGAADDSSRERKLAGASGDAGVSEAPGTRELPLAARSVDGRPVGIEQRKLAAARALLAQGRDVDELDEPDSVERAGPSPGPERPGPDFSRDPALPAPPPARRGAIYAWPDPPTPPFWGSRAVERIPLAGVVPYINPIMLFQVQWQFRKAGRSQAEFDQYLDREVRPIFTRLVEQCEKESILQPAAVYGYWPASSLGDDLVLFDPADFATEVARFTFPRQRREPGLCISDFFLPAESGVKDVVALQLVTVGRRASEVEREWFAADRYREYFFLHGLTAEAAEGLAEFLHKQVRAELGIGGEDAREIRKLFQQGYRGSRYSFGYPACPELSDQAKLWPLLHPERIGVELTDEYQLDPEQSTSAIVVQHPQAKYFNVR